MKYLILPFIIVLFSGCFAKDFTAGEDVATPANTQEMQQTEQTEPEQGIAVNLNNGAATDAGYYETLSINNTKTLMYYDYETMQQLIVCSTLNCTHSDESCLGYVGTDLIWVGTLIDSKELIYYRNGYMPDGTPTIRLELYDATNRFIREIGSYSVGLSILGVSNQRVYAIEYGVGIVSIDVETGRKRIIFNETYQHATSLSMDYHMVGHAQDDSLYVLIKRPEQQLTGSEVSYEELPENTIATLYKVAVDSGLAKEIYSETVNSFNIPNYSFTKNYMVVTTENSCKSYNLLTGEVIEYPAISALEGESIYQMYSMFMIDGYVTFSATNINEATESYYHLNLQTGEAIRSTLSYTMAVDLNFSHTAPIKIVADLGEELIVGISEQSFVYDFEAQDGVSLEQRSFVNTALISKADYLANTPNYRPFDNSTIITALKSLR